MNRRAEIRLLLGNRRLSFDRQDSSTEDELSAMLRLKANQSLFQSKFLLEWVAICSLPWWSYLYFFWSLEAADSEVEVLHAGSPDQTNVSHESGEIPVREREWYCLLHGPFAEPQSFALGDVPRWSIDQQLRSARGSFSSCSATFYSGFLRALWKASVA